MGKHKRNIAWILNYFELFYSAVGMREDDSALFDLRNGAGTDSKPDFCMEGMQCFLTTEHQNLIPWGLEVCKGLFLHVNLCISVIALHTEEVALRRMEAIEDSINFDTAEVENEPDFLKTVSTAPTEPRSLPGVW